MEMTLLSEMWVGVWPSTVTELGSGLWELMELLKLRGQSMQGVGRSGNCFPKAAQKSDHLIGAQGMWSSMEFPGRNGCWLSQWQNVLVSSGEQATRDQWFPLCGWQLADSDSFHLSSLLLEISWCLRYANLTSSPFCVDTLLSLLHSVAADSFMGQGAFPRLFSYVNGSFCYVKTWKLVSPTLTSWWHHSFGHFHILSNTVSHLTRTKKSWMELTYTSVVSQFVFKLPSLITWY